MNAHDALNQIAEIRQRVAWSMTFRGYRASTTALTAGIAALAATTQTLIGPKAGVNVYQYLTIWLSAALLGLVIVGVGCVIRRGEDGSAPTTGAITVAAAECFLPSVVAGVFATYAIVFFQPFQMIGLLPGIWMILFSLGLFASRRLLPGAVFIVASYYLTCGFACLTLHPHRALAPWTMGLTFGFGQLLAAAVLYVTLERPAAQGARS